jgi:hypothetical protein
MSKLIDSVGAIIKDSDYSYIQRLHECLTGDVHKVSEADEVEFGNDLPEQKGTISSIVPFCFVGQITYRLTL